MELQDLLKDHEWSVQKVIELLNPSTNAKTKKFVMPKKKAVKQHETVGEATGSDSESEGDYNGSHMVYDSGFHCLMEQVRSSITLLVHVVDSSNDEGNLDETHHRGDKKRVLDFFNNANEHELSAIQGCSKKKVCQIISLRPFEGWGDLVS
jgi:hypothetical protein